MKRFSTLALATLLSLVASGCMLSLNSNTASTQNVSTSEINGSSTTEQESKQETTKDVVLHTSGNYLNFTNYGIAINNKSSGSTNLATLITQFNDEVGFELVSSITAENVYIQTDYSNNSSKEHLHLSIGTSGSGGLMTFNISKQVKKVEITGCAYYKYVEYNSSFNIDTENLLKIDDLEHHFTTSENTAPSVETFSKEYAKGTASFTLSNNDEKQRVFIDLIKITYIE